MLPCTVTPQCAQKKPKLQVRAQKKGLFTGLGGCEHPVSRFPISYKLDVRDNPSGTQALLPVDQRGVYCPQTHSGDLPPSQGLCMALAILPFSKTANPPQVGEAQKRETTEPAGNERCKSVQLPLPRPVCMGEEPNTCQALPRIPCSS